MSDETKRYLINIESNLAKYAEDAATAKKKVDDLKQSNEALKASGKASAAEIESSNAALRNAQKEYNQAKKLVDLQTQANNSNINSRKQLGAIVELEKYKLGQLANTITVNSKGQRILTDEYKKQVKALADAKQAVINYDKAQNDGRSNIGRYGESVEQSFQAMGSGMLSAVGPAALLATGLNKLKEAFLDTEIGAKAQKVWGEGLKTFFQGLLKGNTMTLGADVLTSMEIAKQADEIRKGNRKDLVEIAKLETEIELLSLKAADATKSKAEQESILLDIKEKENQLIDYKKADLQEELDYINLMLTTRIDDIELLNEQARLQAEILRLEGERSIKVEKRLSGIRQKELEDAQKAKKEAEDAAMKEIESLDKFMELTRKANEERMKRRREEHEQEYQEYLDQLDREQQAQLVNNENLFQIEQSYLNNEFELQRAELERQRQLEIAEAEKTGADVALINAKYTRYAVKLSEYEKEAKLALYADFAGNLATIFGKNTAIGKAAAIAQTTIATYQSATEAYKSLAGIPVWGPALGFTAATAAVASGLANVQKIISVKSGLPGEGSSGATAPTSIAAPRATAQGVGPTILQMPQLSQMQLNSLPNNIESMDMIAVKIVEGMKNIKPVVTVEDINAKTAETVKVSNRANI